MAQSTNRQLLGAIVRFACLALNAERLSDLRACTLIVKLEGLFPSVIASSAIVICGHAATLERLRRVALGVHSPETRKSKGGFLMDARVRTINQAEPLSKVKAAAV